MLGLPQELMVWTRMGLSVFVFACLYLVSIGTMVVVAGWVILRRFVRFRRVQQVVCPGSGTTVDLRIAAGRAAIASIFGERDFRVLSCSRGLPLQQCNHGCVSQMQ